MMIEVVHNFFLSFSYIHKPACVRSIVSNHTMQTLFLSFRNESSQSPVYIHSFHNPHFENVSHPEASIFLYITLPPTKWFDFSFTDAGWMNGWTNQIRVREGRYSERGRIRRHRSTEYRFRIEEHFFPFQFGSHVLSTRAKCKVKQIHIR